MMGTPGVILDLAAELLISENAAHRIYEATLRYAFGRSDTEFTRQIRGLLDDHIAQAERQLEHDIGAWGDNEDAQHAHGLVDALGYLAHSIDPDRYDRFADVSPYTGCNAPPYHPGHPHRCTEATDE